MPQNQLFLFDFWIDFFNNFLNIDQDQDGMLRGVVLFHLLDVSSIRQSPTDQRLEPHVSF